MALVECITGSSNDDDAIARFYALFAGYRPAWHARASCRGLGPEGGTRPIGNASATR